MKRHNHLVHSVHNIHQAPNILLLCVLGVLGGEILPAQTREFTHTARVVMGSRESQEQCREFAKVEARRAVLDQVGVYIEGRSDLMQTIKESLDSRVGAGSPSLDSRVGAGSPSPSNSFSESTDLQKRVLAIAAGVTKLEVTGEEWQSESGALVLYLTCRISVNPEEVAQRLNELVKDRQKVEDYERVQAEVARLRDELTQLRKDLEAAKSEEKQKEVKQAVEGVINGLTARDWFNIGDDLKEYDDKITCFTTAINLDPTWDLPYFARSLVYQYKGEYDKSLSDINYVLQMHPDDPLNYLSRGQILIELKEYNRAINDINQALQIGLDSLFIGHAYIYLGDVYKNMENNKNAIIYYSNALQVNPKDKFTLISRGESFYNDRQYERSIDDYTKALEIDANYIIAYIVRAQAYHKRNKDQEAIVDLNYALKLDNNLFEAYFIRGGIYGVNGLYERAIMDFSYAIDIDSDNGKAYYARGIVYELGGDTLKAKSDFQQAVNLGYGGATEALGRLK